ncbi:hypothetical protein [Paraburkholderia tropica]|uniref:hypothetical protein n=1 Tax=Paraburkholderia tropica TaxID=92647 RepID=UPI003D2E2587
MELTYSDKSYYQDQLMILEKWRAVDKLKANQEVAEVVELAVKEIKQREAAIAERDRLLNKQAQELQALKNKHEFAKASDDANFNALVAQNKKLQEAMAAQQKIIEENLLSHKSFKMLAYKYGNGKGLSDEQVQEDLAVAKEAVKHSVKTDDVVLKHG